MKNILGFEIVAGRRYVRRDGTITPPLVEDWFNPDLWLMDPETDMAYAPKESETGHLVNPYSNEHHRHDLLAEAEED